MRQDDQWHLSLRGYLMAEGKDYMGGLLTLCFIKVFIENDYVTVLAGSNDIGHHGQNNLPSLKKMKSSA